MKKKVIKYDEVRVNEDEGTIDIYYKDELVMDFNAEGLLEHWLAYRNRTSEKEVYKYI